MAGRPPHATTTSTVAAILLTRESGPAFAPARCLAAAEMRFHLVSAEPALAVRTMRGCVGTTRVSDSVFDATDNDNYDNNVALRDVLCQLLQVHPGAVVVPVEMPATTAL